MRCVRCGQELRAGADRCVRCFALNPQNTPAPVAASIRSDPAPAPTQLSFRSDPAPRPVQIAFDDGPRVRAPASGEAPTEPDQAVRAAVADGARRKAEGGARSVARRARPVQAAELRAKIVEPALNGALFGALRGDGQPPDEAQAGREFERSARGAGADYGCARDDADSRATAARVALGEVGAGEANPAAGPERSLGWDDAATGANFVHASDDKVNKVGLPASSPRSREGGIHANFVHASDDEVNKVGLPASSPRSAEGGIHANFVHASDDKVNKVGAPEPAPAAAPPVGLPLARPASFAPASARLGAFAADTALLAALLAAHVAAARLCGAAYILDLVRNTLPAWCVLAALLSVAYGFFFSLAGRTPGMALAGIRLEPLRPASPRRALLRALLALPSAALGCFGFVLALFDARSQTLHDKLCGFVAVTD